MAISESSQLLSVDSFSYRWLVNLSQDPSFRFSIDGEEEEAAATANDKLSLPSSSGFIEMDPKLTPSKRFLKSFSQDHHHHHHDFHFDLCLAAKYCPSEQPQTDVIFSNEKLINPTTLPDPEVDGSKTVTSYDEKNDADLDKMCCRQMGSKSTPATPARSMFLSSPKRFIKCSSLRRCGSLSRRVLSRYLEFLWPICHVIRKGRSGESSSSLSSSSSSSMIGSNKVMTSDRAAMMKLKRGSSSSKVACSSPTGTDSCGRNWRMSCDSDTSIYEAVLHCKRSIGREDNSRSNQLIRGVN